MGSPSKHSALVACPICSTFFDAENEGRSHCLSHVEQIPPGHGDASGQYTWACVCGPSRMKWPNDLSAASALAIHWYGRHGITPESPLDDDTFVAQMEQQLNFRRDTELTPERSPDVEEGFPAAAETATLEGVFVSNPYREAGDDSDDYTRHFFRFYDTGYVVECTVATAGDEPPEWLAWELEGLNRGRYAFEPRTGHIRFETFNEVASIYYEGVVLDAEIKLTSHSYISGEDTTSVVTRVR